MTKATRISKGTEVEVEGRRFARDRWLNMRTEAASSEATGEYEDVQESSAGQYGRGCWAADAN